MKLKPPDYSSLFLAILTTLLVLGLGYLAQFESAMFAFWFLFDAGGLPVIVAAVAVSVLSAYVFRVGVFVRRPVVFAGLLLLPSIPIALIAGGGFMESIGLAMSPYPTYWRILGALSALALSSVTLAVPGLIYRLLSGDDFRVRWVWFPVMFAYAITGIFLLLSYFENMQKIACAVTCLMAIGLAWLGYLTDGKGVEASGEI